MTTTTRALDKSALDMPANDKPTTLASRLIAEHFGVATGHLTIGGVSVTALVETFGSPLYVYDGRIVVDRYRALAAAVDGFAEIYYSIKANPNPAVARLLVNAGAGLEVASGGEYSLARRAGATPDRILFAGPGKGASELDRVIATGIGEIHLESFEEIALTNAIAARRGSIQPVAVRINPAATAQGGAMRMGGKPTAFGFDEEDLASVLAAVAAAPHLRLTGLHMFAGTQILDARVLLAQWRHGLRLAAVVGATIGRPLETIDLGGGLGIPYHDGDATLDLAAVRAGVLALQAIRRAEPWLAGARVLIEPGRYLVGPAGVYLSRVRAVKTSRGHRFIVADGGMHHHLAASGNLGQVIKRDYPIIAASRLDERVSTPASLVGPLCTPLDTLARQTRFPAVATGDIMAVLQSGAYGLTASPIGFLSHPTPAEVLIEGAVPRCIRPAGTFDAPFGLPVG